MSPLEVYIYTSTSSMNDEDLFDLTVIIAHLEYSIQLSYILHKPRTMWNILKSKVEYSSTT